MGKGPQQIPHPVSDPIILGAAGLGGGSGAWLGGGGRSLVGWGHCAGHETKLWAAVGGTIPAFLVGFGVTPGWDTAGPVPLCHLWGH